jgi:hypothetical protein
MKPQPPTSATRKGTLQQPEVDPAPPPPGDPGRSLDWANREERVLLSDYQTNSSEPADSDASAVLPVITRMPDGYEVVEHSVGRAIGQWVLQLRCECGRRWFELEEVDATTCPRCGLLVYVAIRE